MDRFLARTIAAFAMLLVFTASAAKACSCGPPPAVLDEWAMADVVFEGTVLGRHNPLSSHPSRIRSSAEPVEYRFRVTRIWKGTLSDTTAVWSAAMSASCGYPFQVGQSYLVYSESHESQLRAGACGNTKPLDQAADDQRALAILGDPARLAIQEAKLADIALDGIRQGHGEHRLAEILTLTKLRTQRPRVLPFLDSLWSHGSEGARVDAFRAFAAWESDTMGLAQRSLAALADSSEGLVEEAILCIDELPSGAALRCAVAPALGDVACRPWGNWVPNGVLSILETIGPCARAAIRGLECLKRSSPSGEIRERAAKLIEKLR
ncbi:MAG TPA: hypothetical protein VMS93_04285 [Candidatus Saccharimonadales bacterium]|nr:hypothetical protein [Candidatus Saccharimonadales bacterium]